MAISGDAFVPAVVFVSTEVLLALCTSGNVQNVMNVLMISKTKALKTIGMPGKMKDLSDVLINVRESRTAYVQALHLPIYHALCMMVEKEIFG